MHRLLLKCFFLGCFYAPLYGMDPENASFMERTGVYQLEVSYRAGWSSYLDKSIQKESDTIDLIHDREVSWHVASKAQHVYNAKQLKIKNPIPLRMISHITHMKIVKVEKLETAPRKNFYERSSTTVRASLDVFSEYLMVKQAKDGASGMENFMLELFPYGIGKDKKEGLKELLIYIDVTYDTHQDKGLEHDLLLKKENSSLKEKLHMLEASLLAEKEKTKNLKKIKSALKVLQGVVLEEAQEDPEDNFSFFH